MPKKLKGKIMVNYEPKDKDLYRATEKLARFVGSLFEEEIKNGKIPDYVKKTFDLINAYSAFAMDTKSHDLLMRSPYYEFFYQNIEKIEASEEFRILSVALDKNITISKHPEPVGTAEYKNQISLRHNFLTFVILPILVKSNIISTNKFEFDDNLFIKLYSETEQFFYTDTFQFKRIILYNLKMNCDAVAFSNGVNIRKLSKSESDELEIEDILLKHLAPKTAGLCEIYKILDVNKVISDSVGVFQLPSEEAILKNKILTQLYSTVHALNCLAKGTSVNYLPILFR